MIQQNIHSNLRTKSVCYFLYVDRRLTAVIKTVGAASSTKYLQGLLPIFSRL